MYFCKIPIINMIEKHNFKDLMIYVLVIGIFILAVWVIYPVIPAIIYGILLAYITFPVYKFLRKKIKHETTAAFIVCLGFFILVIISLILIIINFLGVIRMVKNGTIKTKDKADSCQGQFILLRR